MISPERMAASRIPVPVALNQFRPKTAGSLVGLGTTGWTRSTRLCRIVTGNCGLVIWLGLVDQLAVEGKTFSGVFIHILPVCVPHTKTMTLRTTHGIQACVISFRVYVCFDLAAGQFCLLFFLLALELPDLLRLPDQQEADQADHGDHGLPRR